MKPEQFLNHFDRISEAPDAIPRLRRFILDLAVRGKLVEQDPRDEPASELLKRIQTEKDRLVKAGRIRNHESVRPIDAEEVPFEIPPSWRWVRLIEVLTKLTDGTHHSPTNVANGDFKYITAKNIKSEGISLADVSYVTAKVHHEIYARCNPEKGDILYIKDGATTGIVTINDLDEPFSMLSSVALLKLSKHVCNRLIVEFLRSTFFHSQMRGLMKGAAITRVTLKRMTPALVPLPPLAEQQRIVAKVDELMVLCDRLESAQAERESRRDRLAAASLNRLNQPADDPSTFQNQARFYFNHLPRLTTKPEQIHQLRQTILNLAVRGKLVSQCSDEESGLELLKRIHRARKHLRRWAILDAAELESPLPEIPASWTWTVVDQIAADDPNAITDGPFGANLKTEHYVTAPGYRVIRLQNIGRGMFYGEHYSYIDRSRFDRLSKHHVRAGDLVVAGLVDPYVRCCRLPDNIGPAVVKADCYRFSVHAQVCTGFALHYVNSAVAQQFAAAHHHGMTLTRIGLGNFRRIPFPLPPLAEQQRIVAKVDELMALCDKLEAQLTSTQTESRRLLEAVLHEALSGSKEHELVNR